METDSEEEHNPMVEENAHSGKRKRSINSNSQSPPNFDPLGSTGSAKDVSDRNNARRTLKKCRAAVLTPGTDTTLEENPSLEHARSFLLPPFPVEILQHVMSFVDPPSLGRLMCVNRYIHSLLDPNQQSSRPPKSESKLLYLTAESLWRCSRRAYEPGMPPPLKHKTELEMFDLIYGKRCQMCGFLPKAPSSRLSRGPWNSGPGPTGARTIWPFKIRLCANCLKSSLLKESELVQPELSHLRTGLLSASFTPSLHYVMSITLAQTPVPARLNITKYYFQPQVEQLLRSAPSIPISGDAAYELWFQQLDASRQEAFTDVSRLEVWELAQKAHNDTLAVPFDPNSRSSASGSSIHSDNLTKSHFTTSSGGFRPALSSRSGFDSSTLSNPLLRYEVGAHALFPRSNHIAGHTTPSNAPRPTLNSQRAGQKVHPNAPDSRFEYGSIDILKMKNEKRAEIERRCAELDPPIQSELLDRLPAFHSALSALMPLEDDGWEKLKGQLINERRSLELLKASNPSVHSHTDLMDTATIGRIATPSAEPVEEDLRKQAFRPVREKLVDFAREYVHSRYAGGFGLTYSSAPQFAADVLIYVRQRFYQNQEREDAEFAMYGQQPPDDGPNGIRTRTLRLEHMRYVFEHAIRPYTELVRKDLFLCSACDTQGRHFAFEAIIQHFASKHTNAFSRGNAVVYWKTEWPIQPPFEPKPGRDIEPSATSYLPPPSGLSGTSEVRSRDELVAFPSSSADAGGLYSGRHAYLPPGELHEPVRFVDPVHPVVRHERDVTFSDPHQPDTTAHWPHYTSREIYALETAANRMPATYAFVRNSGSFRNNGDLLDQSYRPRPRPPLEAPRAQIRQQSDATDETDKYHVTQSGYRMVTTSPRHPRESERTPMSSSSQPVEHISFHESTSHDTRTETLQGPLTSNTRADPSSRPRHFEDQRNYESPRDRSRASSARYFHDLSDRQSLPSITTETPAHSAAERFLESFDVPPAIGHNKRPSRPSSVEQFPRSASRDGIEEAGMILDRRSNTSQPRRYPRFASDIEHESSWSNTLATSGRRYEQYNPEITSTTRPYRNQALDHELYPIRDDIYQHERRHPGTSAEQIIVYDDHPESTLGSDFRESPYYMQRSPTANRYPSDIHPIHSGSRLPEPIYYTGVGSERSYRLDEPRASEIYYADARYDRQQLVLDPETRSYYVRRPEREYLPGYRRIEYERPPHGEVVYDDGDRYHEGGGPSAAARGAHRYDRH